MKKISLMILVAVLVMTFGVTALASDSYGYDTNELYTGELGFALIKSNDYFRTVATDNASASPDKARNYCTKDSGYNARWGMRRADDGNPVSEYAWQGEGNGYYEYTINLDAYETVQLRARGNTSVSGTFHYVKGTLYANHD